jgi:hypothetical protein
MLLKVGFIVFLALNRFGPIYATRGVAGRK